MPPTRLRVVERGRRLEVIDTLTGEAAGRRGDAAAARPIGRRASSPDRIVARRGRQADGESGWLPRATRFDNAATFTTHGFYDNAAPRTVRLDPARASVARWTAAAALVLAALLALVVFAAPFLLVFAGVLLNAKTRVQLRNWTTALIDRHADPA